MNIILYSCILDHYYDTPPNVELYETSIDVSDGLLYDEYMLALA